MNRLYLIFALWSLLVLRLHSQDEQRFTIGVLSGVTLAQIDGDNLQGFDKAGYIGGLRSIARITERLHLSTELVYNQRGTQTKDYKKALRGRRRLYTNYAEISFQINYKEWYSPFTELYKLQLFAGASFGRLLKTKSFDNVENELNFEALAREFNSNDFSLMAGMHYYLTNNIGLGFRFARSLNLLFEANKSDLIEYNPNNLQGYYISLYGLYIL